MRRVVVKRQKGGDVTAARVKTLYVVVSAVIIAVLLYQRIELGWYRASSVQMLAGELSAQLQIASADMERATDFARKGEYEATSDWLTTVATDLARADVAERAYNRALERRLAGESHTTGLSMALGLFGSIAKTNAIALPRNGWTPEIESDLSAMAYDLKLMANRLTKEIFIRADPGEVQSASQAVKRQFKTEAIR